MKTLPKIPVLLMATNMICCFIQADLGETTEAIGKCEGPVFRLVMWEGFDQTDAEIIGQNLQGTTTIKHLDLSKNNINREFAITIIKALKGNKTITCINLSNNNIDGEFASAVIDTIKGNKTITSIDLSNNNINDESAPAVIDALKGNKTITCINLSNNNIDGEFASAVIDTLKGNKITSIDLSNNNINDESAIAMIELLINNSTIEELNLSKNNISYVSDKKTFKDAKEAKKAPNKTLKTLNLSENSLKSEYLGRILYIMCAFGALEEINLQGNNIKDSEGNDITVKRMYEIITSEIAEKLGLRSAWHIKDRKFIRKDEGTEDQSPKDQDKDQARQKAEKRHYMEKNAKADE